VWLDYPAAHGAKRFCNHLFDTNNLASLFPAVVIPLSGTLCVIHQKEKKGGPPPIFSPGGEISTTHAPLPATCLQRPEGRKEPKLIKE